LTRKTKLNTIVVTVITLILVGRVSFTNPSKVVAIPECNAAGVTNRANYQSDVIYQLMTDRFADGDLANNNPYSKSNSYDPSHTDINKYFGGDWQGIIDQIDYLKNMGVTAIWITAPYNNHDDPYLENGTYYNAYHGYWAKDFFVPDEHWGDWAKFDDLVATAHNNGIKVVIDYAPNHTSQTDNVEAGALYQNGTLLGRYDDDPLGLFHRLGTRADYQISKFEYQNYALANLADLSTENAIVQDYLNDSIDVWLSHGIDGIRNDATLHQSDAFRTVFSDHINANPDPVFHFGEYFISTPDAKYDDYATSPDRTGIQILDFEFANTARATFGDFSKTMEDLKNMINYTADDYTYENNAVTWLDSHDKSRLATIQPNREISHAALSFLLTSRGIPVIYYGTEQYMTGINGDAGRTWMTDFNQTTTVYQLIKTLSDLRKSNPAIQYGTTGFRWENDNVLVYERQFYNNIVLIAINRSGTTYNISGLSTNLPSGNYNDYLGGLLNGNNITVGTNGAVTPFGLGPTEVGVWEFRSPNATVPQIGTVGPTMGRSGNLVTIDGDGFSPTPGAVYFGSTAATVQCWSNNEIKVIVPSVTPGPQNVTVVVGENASNPFLHKILSGPQVQVIFHENATTSMGQNIYVVGNNYELGDWSSSPPSIAFWNPNYPDWYLPVNVSASTTIEFKYIKRDEAGVVTWEGGSNHLFITPPNGTADTPNFIWQP